MAEIKLYSYWRSSAAYRVRIALNLKGLDYEMIPVHLVNNGGEQHSAEFVSVNPNELVPVLVDGDITLNQSLVIMDYLDAQYPEPSLMPVDAKHKYLVKALAQDIAIDIHPINNLRVLQYLSGQLNTTDQQKGDWYRHWINTGFHALEQKLSSSAGLYCFCDSVTLADVCLVPQVYNAERFNVDMSSFPTISRVTNQLRQHPAFEKAAPENQPDANS
ncbi:maleylacetoacetate isomerase [Vibrio marisflavi]|uniref:Maleylpyruvate isomerase n=1 Tax=Vibrio marisflavi CECT 7928 TaxID=634439 RepID=A0ABM9A4D8_9VIBR|nr:maleylacetoacetate isomerase [Vibrio marisflavi]CAH0539646.1 Maleylpyruvate isomerase [Vibrio marisflavi CECT 7928]